MAKTAAPKPTGVLILLDDHRKDPHLTGKARCLACEHTWEAVVPAGTVWLECPSCRTERGLLVFGVERKEPHWRCNCGNTLFHVLKDRVYCPNCGADQVGF